MTYTCSYDYEIMQLPNTEEHLVCYQTSQCNWVIIKMLNRYLRRCLLGWHRSRLGFVTPIVGEVSLGPLCNAHHYKPCKPGLTDKDLCRICRNQYEHPGSVIGYWPEMRLGHFYIVLEPVGSARLTFVDDRYYELMCFDVPKVVRSPRYDHRHDEESRNGRDIRIDILDN